MLKRNRFEKEYRRIFSEHGHGSTIWSPLGGGILTGKYNHGKKAEDGRYATSKLFVVDHYYNSLMNDENLARMRKLGEYAKELGYSQA